MSVTVSAGSSGRGTAGRRPKGGVPRAVIQSKLPRPLQEELFRLADATSLSVSDLAAYYLLTGWNQIREEEGLAPIPMPSYLVEEVQEAHRPVEIQDPLEESLLAS